MTQYSPLFSAFVTLLLTFILMVSKAAKSTPAISKDETPARCAAASGVKRLVYVSSIGVNGLSTSGDAKFF